MELLTVTNRSGTNRKQPGIAEFVVKVPVGSRDSDLTRELGLLFHWPV